MKKLGSLAAAVLGLLVVSGGAAMPGSAAPNHQVQTVQFVQREVAHHDFGANTFGGTSRLRSNGKFAGYTSFTGSLHPQREEVHIQLAYALRGGIIIARVTIPYRSARFQGLLVKGSGKYSGVQGTLTGRFTEGDAAKTYVTLHYHL
jgi:hypothetical protein